MMEATNEMTSMALSLHLFFLVIMILIVVRLWILFKKDRDFKELSNIYDRWILYHRAVLSALGFTGVVIMAVVQFEVRWQVWLMVLLWTHMLVMTIKEYMYYKPTSPKRVELVREFVRFCKRKYLIEMIALIVVGIVSYAVSLS